MIDTFSILLAHALIFLACWRLLSRRDLDDEGRTGSDPSAPDDRLPDA